MLSLCHHLKPVCHGEAASAAVKFFFYRFLVYVWSYLWGGFSFLSTFEIPPVVIFLHCFCLQDINETRRKANLNNQLKNCIDFFSFLFFFGQFSLHVHLFIWSLWVMKAGFPDFLQLWLFVDASSAAQRKPRPRHMTPYKPHCPLTSDTSVTTLTSAAPQTTSSAREQAVREFLTHKETNKYINSETPFAFLVSPESRMTDGSGSVILLRGLRRYQR